ncbi:MAG: HNH endonuclease [Chloroflexi bacterium]|nr:HNH endonuclease [Chloroflexota bacterium]MCI0578044.1 HNH endonuclease [Chloroflexota bacterium]MCI0644742.1 HNH endonuclease [Chloroflexota bacterium]MCI0728647.1 HNH endonuclease [Chloroflexota bacterium]
MSKTRISKELRDRVAKSAKYRCGYCQTQEIVIGMPLVVDHIIPEKAGGRSEESNLWSACRRCNEYKGDQTTAIDPETGQEVPLFNPRTQAWSDHFFWDDNGTLIVGLTPIGRATVVALNLNNEYAVRSRRRWVSVGWHPPQ